MKIGLDLINEAVLNYSSEIIETYNGRQIILRRKTIAFGRFNKDQGFLKFYLFNITSRCV